MEKLRPRVIDGVYYAEWYESGKRRRKSLGCKTEIEAEVAINHIRSSRLALEHGTPHTVDEIFSAYKLSSLSGSSGDRAGYAWLHLSRHFSGLTADLVTEESIEIYTRSRSQSGAKDGTIISELTYLRAALRYAQRKKWIAVAPFVKLPSKPPPRDLHLTKQQARAVLDGINAPHLRLFFVLALSTAGRMGAILDLTWDRVDFERRKIILANPDVEQTSKGRAITPMNEIAYAELAAAHAGRTSEHVVEWAAGRVGSVKKALQRAGTRGKLPFRLSAHVLRHTAAVWMAEAGVPMEAIAQYLGHKDVNTTRSVYARFSPDYLRGASEALNF